MNVRHSRTRSEMIIGKKGLEKLKNAKVAIFGIGGVGSFAAEALARSGVGQLVLVDFDTIDITNINRQIHAFPDTVNKKKADVMAERILRIDPSLSVKAMCKMYEPQNAEDCFNFDWDYVIDAIDMVSAKIDLIERCKKKNIPIVSSMGTGNKFDPSRFKITDIYKTHTCPLAKVMRKELRSRSVSGLDVCFSDEIPTKPTFLGNEESTKKIPPGSLSFVPPVAGMICAGKVVSEILSQT